MPKRPVPQAAKPAPGQALEPAKRSGRTRTVVVNGRPVIVDIEEEAPRPAGRTTGRSRPDDEGIDYSDIPDVGDDTGYWTGGRVGPVLPTGGRDHSS